MSSSSVSMITVILLAVLKTGHTCGGIGSGGQILTNPSMNMKFYPPVGWTYPSDTALTTLSYLPGQSLTQTAAQNMASGALMAAVLEGLNAINQPTTGVTVTSAYTAPLVNDCIKESTSTGTAAGTQFGIVENGAVTKLASTSGTTAITPANCIARSYITAGSTDTLMYTPFIQQASVKIDGIVISEYQMNMVAAKVASILQLSNGAQFTEEIVVN